MFHDPTLSDAAERAWAEQQARVARTLGSWVTGTAMQEDAAAVGISKAGELYIEHHRAGCLHPFAYYCRVARNQAASEYRRFGREVPVDFHHATEDPELRRRFAASLSVDGPEEGDGILEHTGFARQLLERLGFDQGEIDGLCSDRGALLRMAAFAFSGVDPSQGDPDTLRVVEGALRAHVIGERILAGVAGRTASRRGLPVPLVAAAVLAALALGELSETGLARHLSVVVGGSSATGGRAQRTKRVAHDLAHRVA